VWTDQRRCGFKNLRGQEVAIFRQRSAQDFNLVPKFSRNGISSPIFHFWKKNSAIKIVPTGPNSGRGQLLPAAACHKSTGMDDIRQWTSEDLTAG